MKWWFLPFWSCCMKWHYNRALGISDRFIMKSVPTPIRSSFSVLWIHTHTLHFQQVYFPKDSFSKIYIVIYLRKIQWFEQCVKTSSIHTIEMVQHTAVHKWNKYSIVLHVSKALFLTVAAPSPLLAILRPHVETAFYSATCGSRRASNASHLAGLLDVFGSNAARKRKQTRPKY